MANARRGEIDAMLDGKTYQLCLTLGALAELECSFGEEDMLALAQRFEAGRISARDACRVIGAGLRGAGHQMCDQDVARMQAEGGVVGFIDIVARLLGATFAGDERAAEISHDAGSSGKEQAEAPVPFPGTR